MMNKNKVISFHLVCAIILDSHFSSVAQHKLAFNLLQCWMNFFSHSSPDHKIRNFDDNLDRQSREILY